MHTKKVITDLYKKSFYEVRKLGLVTGKQLGVAQIQDSRVIQLLMKNRLWIALFICLVIIASLAIDPIKSELTYYEYSYKGKVLGVVKSQGAVLDEVEHIEKLVAEKTGVDVKIDADADIELTPVFGPSVEIDAAKTVDDVTAVEEKIEELASQALELYEIKLNGEVLGQFESEAICDDIIKQAEERILGTPLTGYLEVGTEEVITKEIVVANVLDIDDAEPVISKLVDGGIKIEEYTVVPGDTLYDIAIAHGITEEELLSYNQELNPETLQLGSIVKLQGIKPLLTIKTTENKTFIEKTPYETTYEDTEDLYVGEEKVVIEGIEGDVEINADITTLNGAEIARVEHLRNVIAEPVTAVVKKGTREKGVLKPGYLIQPINGGFSSPFGSRWGRMHKGVDFTASVGTPVYAADSGVVVSCEQDGSGYGNIIVVDHGGGIETAYAHLSAFTVSPGTRVMRGDQIASSGNTGRSTGPHLHFEVRINGTAVNPMQYL
jgi:murein DD-endopeptidase MepM/ murein hydrolase activator NlpD